MTNEESLKDYKIFEAKDDGFYNKLNRITYAYDKEIIEVLLNSLFGQTLRFEQYKQEYEQKVRKTLQKVYDNPQFDGLYTAQQIEEIAEDLGVELE